MREHRETIVACGSTLLSILLTENMFPDPSMRLVFVAVAALAVLLYFKGDENNSSKLQYLSYLLVGGLCVAIAVHTIAPEFPSRLLEGHEQSTRQEQENVPSPQEEYLNNQQKVSLSLERLQGNVDQASGELTELTGALQAQFSLSRESYPDEIQELLDMMREQEELIAKEFPDITSEADILELFYKTRLYEPTYHYNSFIGAFEAYGIDCKSMSIDEYTLMLWDVENLYIFYSMGKGLEPDLAANKWMDQKALKFQDHKDRDADLLNYGEWQIPYTHCYAQDIADSVDRLVMNYYQRFHLNFTRKPR